MTPDRYPAHLRLVGTTALGVRTHPRKAAGARAGRGRRDCRDAVELLSRETLLHRLETVAELTGDAPLSFVAVKVCGLKELHEERGWDACEQLLGSVATTLRNLVRATDSVGRLNASTFGVVLQGTGTVAAAAVAARLSHRLNQLDEVSGAVDVRVGAATGTGHNAQAMPIAALAAFEECAG